MNKIFISIDYGRKYIGIAIGNSITCKSRPLSTLKNKNFEYFTSSIKIILKKWNPNKIILGIPESLNNTLNKLCIEIKNFKKKIQKKFNIPIKLVNENYSSIKKIPYKKKHTSHSNSASIILQQYLNEYKKTKTLTNKKYLNK